MQTAKKLGFKKGDFVWTGMFPGIIVGDVHTATPQVEVWGLEHETGSCYSSNLRPMSYEEFVAHAEVLKHTELKAYDKMAQAALDKAKREIAL